MRVISTMDSTGHVTDESREVVQSDFNSGILYALSEISNCFLVKCVRYWISVFAVVCL